VQNAESGWSRPTGAESAVATWSWFCELADEPTETPGAWLETTSAQKLVYSPEDE